MNLLDLIKTRNSTREFTDTPVKISDIKEIIQTAQDAPSWVNSQPWHVYVATGDTLNKIKLNHIHNYEEGIAPNSDFKNWHREEWDPYPRENMANNTDFKASHWDDETLAKYKDQQKQLYDAPALLYLTIPKKSPNWSIYDAGSFGENILLAAKAKGIDSIPAYEIIKYPDDIRRIMGIPNSELLAIGIALGYGKKNTIINEYNPTRVPLDKMLKIKD